SGKTTNVAHTKWNVGHGGRYYYLISWSPDSKWITFELGMDNSNNAVFVYNLADKKLNQVTSGFFFDYNPVFSEDGKYIYCMTNRSMKAVYSDLGDGTWVYPNSSQMAVISLTKGAKSLLYTENDSYKPSAKKPDPGKKDDKKKDKKKAEISVKIDLDDIESRMEILPPKAGNMGRLFSLKGKIIYVKWPNSGSSDKDPSLMFYDIKKRKMEKIISGVSNYIVSSDGKSILVKSKRSYGIIKPAAGQKIKKPIPTNSLVMNLVPKEEWHQIFNDIWRRYRDFFYDPAMQGVDWNLMRKRYGALIDHARTRLDVNNICSNLSAELSAGHTYTFGGDSERVPPSITGFLGIDWGAKNSQHIVRRIVRPAAWDTITRSPFDKPGVNVVEGDYILAVNGIELDPDKDP
ncbi:MAG: PDZ domain-containing protein, partial [Candidatus Aminicenantes bacterium]|nr:PDZ domain-containing protein [Candidatus Aminicenantes bacterium]